MGRMIFMKSAERFFRDLEELNDQAKLCKILLEKFNIEDGTTECEIPDDEIEYFKNAFHKLNGALPPGQDAPAQQGRLVTDQATQARAACRG